MEKMEKLKNITLLNEDETKEIAKKLWDNDEMQKYIISKYDFYRFNDGLIIELEKVKKISIDKTFYYDDEFEAPEITEKNFINYNMKNDPARGLENYLKEKESLFKNGCASGMYDYKNIYLITHYYNNDDVVDFNWFDEKDERYFKRYLTNEEEKEFIKLMFERKEQYIDRLKKYFKKYSNKIYAMGYWANR